MGSGQRRRIAAFSAISVALSLLGLAASAGPSDAQPAVGAPGAAETSAPLASAEGVSAGEASAGEASAGEASAGSSPGAAPSALDPLTASPSLSTSIGGPSSGRIEGAIPLPASAPGLRSNPRRPNPDAYYGTVELVRSLVRAAAAVHARLPGSDLVINDIGLPQGGPIRHHGSHQAGRDVDVLFYYLDAEGEVFPSKGIPVDRRGRGWDFADLADPSDDVRVRLDVPRTWAFVQALLEDDLAGQGGHVQRIFVAEHVRSILLEHAERTRAPGEVRARFADLTCQPGHPHDDHFHVRFFCSDEDLRAGCADSGPMYPWRRQQLRAAEVEPVREQRARRARAAARQRTTSQRDAAAAAGRMHHRVRAFLDQRAEWSVQPHPGRPFCR